MCDLNKIISYKLKRDDLDLLGETLKRFSSFQLIEEVDFSQLLKREKSEIAAVFIYVDESFSKADLESLIKAMSGISINIVLKYKDFDLLMLCYKYQVSSVFESKLSKVLLENALVRVDLMSSKQERSLPVTEIVKLFSTPVKIKTNTDFFQRVASYLNSFEEIRDFFLIEKENEKFHYVGASSCPQEIQELIKTEILPRKYIGVEKEIDIDNQFFLVTPLFSKDKSSLWLAAKVDQEKKEFVFNHLFYKYIENLLIYRMNKEKEQNLTVLATTDEITGLYNQRKLSQDLEKAIKHHEIEDETFSIMFIDIDHFKQVNDNYGHVVGSKLLQDIGEVLSLILRASDHIYRYGGDEFVVIMPTVDIETVHDIATRVLEKIKNKKFDIGNGEKYNLSVSIGIAEYPTDAKSALEIIKFADEMMYMSKRSGRGKVFHVNEVENANVSSE